MGAAGDLSSPVAWEKALYSELPKPTRIGHSIGHWVQKLLPDENSQLTCFQVPSTRFQSHKADLRSASVAPMSPNDP